MELGSVPTQQHVLTVRLNEELDEALLDRLDQPESEPEGHIETGSPLVMNLHRQDIITFDQIRQRRSGKDFFFRAGRIALAAVAGGERIGCGARRNS